MPVLAQLMHEDGFTLSNPDGESQVICPFHQDTKPSMGVNGAKDVYRCRACGASGNAVTWLRKYRGLDNKRIAQTLEAAGAPNPHKPSTPRQQRTYAKPIDERSVLADMVKKFHPEGTLMGFQDWLTERLNCDWTPRDLLTKRGRIPQLIAWYRAERPFDGGNGTPYHGELHPGYWQHLDFC